MSRDRSAWNRPWRSLLVAGALAMGATGCSDTENGLAVLPSEFPGSDVRDAFVADDGRAFSHNNWSVSNVQVFRNRANGDAIVTYRGREEYNDRYGLFASYWNGREFTSPIQIAGLDQARSDSPVDVQVLFLNTAKFTGATSTETSNGRARNGDAIVIYRANDEEDTTSPQRDDRDANRRVWGTYFDRSLATKPAANGVVNGFQTVAVAIDFESVVDGAANDEGVDVAAFASDSLHGTHVYAGSESHSESGDPTSFVQILFRKSPSRGATTVADRWLAIPFWLGQDGNALTVASGATDGQLNPAVGSLEDTDTVGSSVIVHNGTVVWTATGADADGLDLVTTGTVFGTGPMTAINLGSDPTPDADDTTPLAVLGADDGLAATYVLLAEDSFSNGMTGSRSPDIDLMLAQIDPGQSGRAIVEVDNFKNPIDLTDGDNDTFGVRVGDRGNVALSSPPVFTVNADRTAIVVAWLQDNTDLTDANPNDMLVLGTQVNRVPFTTAVATGRAQSALASSVAAPVRLPALESSGDTVDQGDARALAPQLGLGRQQAWQTNPNRVYFRYVQDADVNAGTPTDSTVRLFVSGIDIGLGGDVPTLTPVRGSIDSAFIQFPGNHLGQHRDWSNADNGENGFYSQLVDRGTAAGEFLLFFNANDNNTVDTAEPNGYAAQRLYVSDGTNLALVSSSAYADLRVAMNGVQIERTNDYLHVLFQERAGGPTSNAVLATRSFRLGAAAVDAQPALGGTLGPAFIGLPHNAPVFSVSPMANGRTLGVYFQQNDHIWYQETNSDALHYRTAGGLPDPTLVDNDTTNGLESFVIVPGIDNSLEDSFVLYTKYPDEWWERLFVRTHD